MSESQIGPNWVLDALYPTQKRKEFANQIENDVQNYIGQLVCDNSRLCNEKNKENEPLKLPTIDILKNGYSNFLIDSFRQPSSQFSQVWTGEVISIDGDEFVAILHDIINEGTDEIGTFSIKNDAFHDKDLVNIGSIFYLSVGYITNRGTRSKVKEMVFKRSAEISSEKFEKILLRADRLAEKFSNR